MLSPSVTKCSGVKIVPHSDLRVGTASNGITKKQKTMRVATWNVRSLGVCGKLENVKLEMMRLNVNVLGMSEIKWKNEGDFWSGDHRIIFSGDNASTTGVGVVLDRKWGRRVKSYMLFSDRIMLIKLEVEGEHLAIMQTYMPTSGYSEEELEVVYEQIEEVLSYVKENETLIILGDWNAVVGEGSDEEVIGRYGLGNRNEWGQRLIDFCVERNLVIANTLFQQPLRRRYTWIQPGDVARYQIDYIILRKKHKRCIQQCKTYPGADICSDHNVVIMDFKLQGGRRTFRQRPASSRWAVDKLKMKENAEKYNCTIKQVLNQVEQPVLDTHHQWENLKNAIVTSAKVTLGYQKEQPRSPWISDDTIALMEVRRRHKRDKNRSEYNRLRNLVNRRAKKDKQEWLGRCCDEIENSFERGNIEKSYNLIRKMFGRHVVRSNIIKSNDMKILMDNDEVADRWKEYVENLYNSAEGFEEIEKEEDIPLDELGPPITFSEMERALHELKSKKAYGADDIPAELLQALDEEIKNTLFILINNIYITGKVPLDFKKSMMVMLPKKNNATRCDEYRTLSILSHVSKILTSTILRRIESRIDANLADDQFGFRRNRGTREAILCLRNIVEKSFQVNKRVYIAFVDLLKAFDRVNWNVLMQILKRINVDYRDRRIITELYKNQTAFIKVGEKQREAAIKRGVRQGCNLSPLLFNIYIEQAINKCKEYCSGIKVNGVRVQMLRFADDIAIVAQDKRSLERALNTLHDILRNEYDMEINKVKTEVMICSKEPEIESVRLENSALKQVKRFKYLGSIISEDGKDREDIKRRIREAKAIFMSKRHLFSSDSLKLDMRKRLIKSCIWSIALYGSETWTIGKVEERAINAFEVWCWRRMLRVKWTDRVTNEEVFQRAEEERCLMNILKDRRHSWIGHIIRHNEFTLSILEGIVTGQRGRGRPRLQYLKQITKDLGVQSYIQLKRLALDRKGWRAANQSND